ncbi:MAG TPA: DUF2520 domain-containing protein [Gemmatimonadales bacterium]|nr:DUF2520 domain-containing protein [Gemmatimonadales bacterium]
MAERIAGRVAVVGAGRMGQGIALALTRAGRPVALSARRAGTYPPGPEVVVGDLPAALRGADVVLLAVPDDAIATLALDLARSGGVESYQAVLHLSGVRDRSVLGPLDGLAAGLGSFWPLQTVADPLTAPDRLAGAFAVLEGDPAAVAAGEGLATALGMTAVRIPSAGKPLAHAGAVLAANYVVALLAMAERLAESAGIAPALAGEIYLPLTRAAIENTAAAGAAHALTGPIRRGDLRTVAAHLEVLGPEIRPLYLLLARETLRLAEAGGLDPERAAQFRELLRD